jgi:hypothetical protein
MESEQRIVNRDFGLYVIQDRGRIVGHVRRSDTTPHEWTWDTGPNGRAAGIAHTMDEAVNKVWDLWIQDRADTADENAWRAGEAQ